MLDTAYRAEDFWCNNTDSAHPSFPCSLGQVPYLTGASEETQNKQAHKPPFHCALTLNAGPAYVK